MKKKIRERHHLPLPPRIILFVDGGIIHDVMSDKPVQLRVIDYDIEGDARCNMIRLPGNPKGAREAVSVRKFDLAGVEGKAGLDFFFKQRSIR